MTSSSESDGEFGLAYHGSVPGSLPGFNEDEDVNDQIEDKVEELEILKLDQSERTAMLKRLEAKLSKSKAARAEQETAIQKYQEVLDRARNISYGHLRDVERIEKVIRDNEEDAEANKQNQKIRILEQEIAHLRTRLPADAQHPRPNPAKRNSDGLRDFHELQRKRRCIRQKDEDVELVEPEFHTGEGWTRVIFAEKNGIVYAYMPISEAAREMVAKVIITFKARASPISR
ncbi:hypothetical protein PG993_002399 [Apiospora rasikravindrae]|uniref:Uncharacterized protein n=1 Tax=Apiospora rasikravindrae TaxID=990691 RepID=A0ABR1TWJ1_9PEZI